VKKQNWFRRWVWEHKWELILKHGFKYPTVQRWMNGERNPTLGNAEKLARLYEIPVEKFPYVRMFVINE